MPTPAVDPGLADRIAAFVGGHTGATVSVQAVKPLAGGACQDNLRVDLTVESGPFTGEHRMVLRSDAGHLLEGTLDREREYAVIHAAVEAGVNTPSARWPGHDVVREGAGVFFLDFADGVAIGRKVLRDPALAEARAKLPTQLAVELAKIHSVLPPWRGGPTLPVPEPPNHDPEEGALTAARRMLDDLEEPHAAQEWIFRWLADHRPGDTEVTLVHRDFRLGNFLVTADGLSALLDWEFAGWGHPAEDLAWISVRDWRFGNNHLPVGGFAKRDAFYTAYTEASGRPVDRAVVLWWEVMGNLRWSLGCTRQGVRYLSGENRDLELIAIARRAAEMEFEALRLIEKGSF
jgi:aminoglycoside phosphotransferase (APT) family kinase protein